MSVQVRADYPRLGPLLARAFDEALYATVGSWPVVLILVVVSAAGAAQGTGALALNICTIPWAYFAGANAVRTISPGYRMTAGTVGRLLLANIIACFAVVFGLLALVWPGFYFGTKFSVAPAAIALDGVTAEVGLRRSWELTTGRFWRTFLFLVVSTIAIALAVLIPDLVVIVSWKLLVAHHLVAPTRNQALAVGIAIIAPFVMYAIQTGWIALLYWYRSLKAMADAGLQARPAPPSSGAGT
ncbi:MAG TPA: hypothetical protein VKF82_04905 [Candidatus Eremiobacteraceae bacterium]|nr:hypothetical protein [Candidatus Eremiobacteraceae bacterium]